MNRQMVPLPAPLSPCSKTGMFVLAARTSLDRSSCITAERPKMVVSGGMSIKISGAVGIIGLCMTIAHQWPTARSLQLQAFRRLPSSGVGCGQAESEDESVKTISPIERSKKLNGDLRPGSNLFF